jgi:hypothetical protein
MPSQKSERSQGCGRRGRTVLFPVSLFRPQGIGISAVLIRPCRSGSVDWTVRGRCEYNLAKKLFVPQKIFNQSLRFEGIGKVAIRKRDGIKTILVTSVPRNPARRTCLYDPFELAEQERWSY